MKEEKQYCDKCGKCMTMDDETEVIGMAINFENASGDDAATTKFFKEQLGKYEPGRRYQVCWECMLDNMLGKGLKEAAEGKVTKVDISTL